MTPPAIEVENLRKVYSSAFGRRRITALERVDISVPQGEVFGLLGPNGAGKTTMVKILLDLTRPTEGTARIQGIPVSRAASRRRVGYLPEGHRFPGYLTARETLSIFGRMSGMDGESLRARIPLMLERVHLAPWAEVRVKKFSKGMTQRLGLAAAMIHDPLVLLLDEPTDGVDPVGRRQIRDLLKAEAREGKAIFLNSHLLSEIELTCDRVAMLRKGAVAAIGRIDELTRREPRYRMVSDPMDERLIAALSETGAGVERSNGHLLLTVRDIEHLNALIDRARATGASLHEVTPIRSTLEDVFVDLIRTDDPGAEVGA
ncbi:MAG: ATP-binding cassette domain-containing protein [Thermoanaerobaculia bacterium]